ESALGVKAAPRLAALLSDPGNPMLLYDLLGVLKSGFLDRIFIQPDGIECPSAREAVALALSIGAIPAYAYLGDVGESPTGDKKAEKFEDDFLDELFDELAALGFPAVCYMPPRNTREQLAVVRELCAERGFLEISGVDINSPRQSFNCPELRLSEFAHLRDATWALVAHETLSELDQRAGMLSPGNPLSALPVPARVAAYARAGRALDSPFFESASAIAHDLLDGRFSR
ncbi:MAG: PHP domain-containing protein, partial [Spirochaetaceae bacterium]|nr:PHP domain-containing protein [Spirochaetaceae bacterium]